MSNREATRFGVMLVVTTDTSISISVQPRLGTVSADLIPTDVFDRSLLPLGACVWWIGRCLVTNIERRGQGIGSMLIQRLQAVVSGLRDNRMIVVSPGGYGVDPEKQYEFYRKHGFIPAGEGLLSWTPPTN